jgi:hypothetical protein
MKLNQTTLFKFEFRNTHVIFLTTKNLKFSHFIQHDKNKLQPPLIDIHYTICNTTVTCKDYTMDILFPCHFIK